MDLDVENLTCLGDESNLTSESNYGFICWILAEV